MIQSTNQIGHIHKVGRQELNQNRFFILESSLQTYSIPPIRVKEYGDTRLSFWKKEQ